ncbi:unnamed protein product [Rhizopus stolonifer]
MSMFFIKHVLVFNTVNWLAFSDDWGCYKITRMEWHYTHVWIFLKEGRLLYKKKTVIFYFSFIFMVLYHFIVKKKSIFVLERFTKVRKLYL